MNLKEISFKDRLNFILKDLNRVEDTRSQEQKFVESVENKLDLSLDNYYQNLLDTCKYLLSKNPVSMMKNINQRYKELEDEEND